jgi:diguanylate cyclase (GGDEF)-like protein/PAS domain S-box-containing protein
MKGKPDPLSKAELRRLAEAAWADRKKKTGPLPVTVSDARRLVHELQVHQIELEMQNEALMQIREELEEALRKYTDLYDYAPAGYFSLAPDGTICQVNLVGASLLGIERGELAGRRLGVFIPDQSRETFNAFLAKVFESRQKQTCEIALQQEGGAQFWAYIEALYDSSRGQDEECQIVMSDITARKQAQEKLKYMSSHDALTGLYNRGFFVEEMARLGRGRRFPASIIMIDVDHLKDVNDGQGHAAGDALLKRVGQALTAAFRAEDVIARIGGDEFAVLLPSTDASAAGASLDRLRQVIQENNAAHPRTPIRLSLGMSTAGKPTHLTEVLKAADADMYREKRGKQDDS